jgi:hypothetical protein
MAWTKSPGRLVGIMATIASVISEGDGRGQAFRRAITRATFVSTAGATSPNAIAAIAEAVYRPIPGSLRSSAADFGNPPSIATWRAQAIRFRARA